MTFKIVLTCLYAVEIALRLQAVDKPREPIGPGSALFSAVVDGVLIYGIWHWL